MAVLCVFASKSFQPFKKKLTALATSIASSLDRESMTFESIALFPSLCKTPINTGEANRKWIQ